jgi:hypothetical protein
MYIGAAAQPPILIFPTHFQVLYNKKKKLEKSAAVSYFAAPKPGNFNAKNVDPTCVCKAKKIIFDGSKNHK